MDWDYVVIGAGSAGCAVVHHLVRSGKRVLLIEAGGADRNLRIKFPFMMLQALDRFDWGYTCEPDETRLGRSERWQRGRVLGGTSSVNGMIYVRGSDADFDLWASRSDDSWSSSNVRTLFREMERCDPCSIATPDCQRGYSGPLHVRMVRHPHRTTRAFIDAMSSKGYPYNSDYNAATQEGIGFTQLTQHGDRRFSAFDAFVRPQRHAPNLQVMTGCVVSKINIVDGRATGVAVVRQGAVKHLRAGKVVLSAGSLNSPKILMLSGIGDAVALAALGINVVLDRPAVGQGLSDHPIVRITYHMNVPTYAIGSLRHCAVAAAKYLFQGQGLLASAHEATAFVRSVPDLAEPDLQFHFAPIGVAPVEAGRPPRLMKTPSVFISIKKNHPRSRGSIRLRSIDPMEPPVIIANLLEDRSDTTSLVSGIQILRDVMATGPIRAQVRAEHEASASYRTQDELADYVRRNVTIACHSVGTCRMGNDPACVADPSLRVRGIANLWIADASIMPENISGNTNAAAMMIGYKLGKELASAK